MLILSRKPGESIMIGDTVEITLLPNNHSRFPVRLGIKAPSEISVHRMEIYQKIKQQQAQAKICGEQNSQKDKN